MEAKHTLKVHMARATTRTGINYLIANKIKYK